MGEKKPSSSASNACSLRHRPQGLAAVEGAVDDPHEGDHAPVLVVRGVEDERPGRRLVIACRRRDPLDDRVQHGLDPLAGLRRDPKDLLGILADELGDFGGRGVGIRLREVDLVHDRDDLQVVLDGEIRVRDCLRLDALRGVHDEQRALAGLERARDLVGEVDVARRVDQVQLEALPGDPHGLGLDRDPALALELHRVEHLRAHVPAGDRVGHLENAVGERRLAVVDVGDDREVADLALLHCRGSVAALSGASGRPVEPQQAMRHAVLLDLADGPEAGLLVFDRIAPPAPNRNREELAPPTQRQQRVELAGRRAAGMTPP